MTPMEIESNYFLDKILYLQLLEASDEARVRENEKERSLDLVRRVCLTLIKIDES